MKHVMKSVWFSRNAGVSIWGGIGVLWISVVTASGSFAREEITTEAFAASARIEGSMSVGQIGKIVLEPWVFKEVQQFPADIRILDDDGVQWPFFLHIPTAEPSSFVPVEIRNLGWREEKTGEANVMELDVLIPSGESGSRVLHHAVEVETSGSDYLRRVEVSTGRGNELRLGAGYLVQEPLQSGARNIRISYPRSDLDRLHLRIYKNVRNESDTFEVRSVKIERVTAIMDEEPRELVHHDVLEPDASASSDEIIQVLEFDLGQSQVPVEWIRFDVDAAAFVRSISLFGRNDEQENWKWIHTDVIYRKGEEAVMELDMRARASAYRFLRLEEHHDDDPPLKIRHVEMFSRTRFLVFQAITAGPARLCVGNRHLGAPRYDLVKRMDRATVTTLPLFKTSEPVKTGSGSGVRTWMERYGPWLSLVIVGIVTLMILRIVVSMMRKLEAEPKG